MFKATLLAAAIAVAGLAQAQTPTPASPAKKELIAKIMLLQQPGVENMARQMVEQPAMQAMQAAGQALQRLPAERREAVGRDIEADIRKYVEEATPIVRDRAVKLAPTTVGALMEERFTEDELKQIVTLLESPVNKKFQSLFPEMQKALAEKLIADTRGDVEVKLRAMQTSIGQRLGIAPSGAASAASGPKAAPSKAAAPAKK